MKKHKWIWILLLTLVVLAGCKKKEVSKKEIPLYETDFSTDDGHWTTGNLGTAGASAAVSNGYYVLKGGSGGREVWTGKIFSGTTGGAALEASVKLSTNGGANDGAGGLIWGLKKKDDNDLYTSFYFEISYDGYYTVWGYPNGSEKPYVIYRDWVLNGVIRENELNKLRITLVNNELRFYINDRELFAMPSPGNSTLDQPGFKIRKYSTMQVDYFKALQLP
ncbi:hypothetical protein LL912_22285 [Niabella sp. CC-SYL272]|uniref:hypothetical protein n=1 Tax=Niabella agricola TaxID=2891571 RepID=UPI001F26D150|nr:hypothetical protein [Niabella agricola]MCF3111532.1 hypothetical protein [Niabella agricola]